MQNSYTKKGQLNWWLALCLWIHKGFKTQKYFFFNPISTQAGPALPIDQSTGSVARLRLGHGPYSSAPAGPLKTLTLNP